MKLSIAWIFNHINADVSKQDILGLVKKFNLTTAEVEQVEKISWDRNLFTLVQVIEIAQDSIKVHSRELNQSMELPSRQDCVQDYFYMLVKDGGTWRWAKMSDWNSSKEALLPALCCTGTEYAGSWKQMLDQDDYILHVDNKSITNRPDLWSHRGFAREIAAILGLPLRDEQTLYATHQVTAYSKNATQSHGNHFNFELQDSEYCKRFAAVYIPNIGHYASWLLMAQRLCKVDIKPIDALVDATNYVMLDIGQPLHAFDADKINSHTIVPRFARAGESLTLLDGQSINLTDHDIVITNGKRPIALGGVMGGKDTAISIDTRSILVEAANFDATTIRKTAQRFKLRTDASTRFEKTVDPNLNVLGLLRFLKILEEHNIPLIAASDIISLGKPLEPLVLDVTHVKIEQSLGVSISQDFVIKTLKALEFLVEISGDIYRITIPTFRSTKDVRIVEDIVEEIGRFYGYGNIIRVAPKLESKPYSLHAVMRLRHIREFLAGSLQAREVCNYAFYDEQFLQELRWKPEHPIAVVNPVSHNWQSLVTSLVPHLIKSVVHAGTHQDEIRFFEWARTWNRHEDGFQEQKTLAGILYHKKEPINFYLAKDQLDRLFNRLGISVTWKAVTEVQPWFHPYKTAMLHYKNRVLGYAGVAQSLFMQPVLEGHAFIFELQGDLLLEAQREQAKFKHLNKYQDSWFDVSMFLPLEVTVQQVTQTIRNVDNRIVSVRLADFFEKPEWVDKRSITVRVIVQDSDKTLVTQEIDLLYKKVVAAVAKYGVTIR